MFLSLSTLHTAAPLARGEDEAKASDLAGPSPDKDVEAAAGNGAQAGNGNGAGTAPPADPASTSTSTSTLPRTTSAGGTTVPVTWWELFREWAPLGYTTFGGPSAHVGQYLLVRLCRERRRGGILLSPPSRSLPRHFPSFTKNGIPSSLS